MLISKPDVHALGPCAVGVNTQPADLHFRARGLKQIHPVVKGKEEKNAISFAGGSGGNSNPQTQCWKRLEAGADIHHQAVILVQGLYSDRGYILASAVLLSS